jgi:membrane protease YdiL (CAAX protease family)
MKTFAAILGYLAFVFGGGALVAPWIHYALQGLPPSLGLSGMPFHLVVSRSLFGMALLGLYGFIRLLGAKAADIGLAHPISNLRWLGFGAMAALVMFGLLAGAAVAAGARRWVPPTSLNFHLSMASNILPAALVTAFLVELLFRGAVFGAVQKAASFSFALALSSALYAVVLSLATPANPPEVGWLSGLEMLELMVGGFAENDGILPALVINFALGLLLALFFHRTGTLYAAIGLHAGILFFSRWVASVAPAHPRADPWIWGGSDMLDGWAALGMLAAALLLAAKFLRVSSGGPKTRSPQEAARAAKPKKAS